MRTLVLYSDRQDAMYTGKNDFDAYTAFLRLSEGSEEAFESIYRYYSPRLFDFIDRMLHFRDVTEEIVQDVFISLWQKRAYLATVDNPRSYLYQMASNKVLDYQRTVASRKPILDFVIAQQATSTTDTEERILYKETLLLLEDALDALSPQRRLIYELSRQEGLSHEEIADRLQISKSTVANQMVSALKSIRKHLEKHSPMFSFAVFYILTR